MRKSAYPIDRLFMNRWSPRALSGELISNDELMTLFEAARWAPSSYNNQPWRFIYAYRDTSHWKSFFDLMLDFNKAWAKNASVLVIVISRTVFEFNNQPSISHSFDTGAACENLALQATIMGLVAHAIEGFDYQKAKHVLNIPDDYAVEIMCAIGKPGKKEDLPVEMQKKEELSDRKPLSEIVFEGSFKI